MNPRSRLALALLLGLAGCSDDFTFDDGFDGFDGLPPPPFEPCGREPLFACNPFAPAGQQGCTVGFKCSWAAPGDPVEGECSGRVDCAPDGFIPRGGNCSPIPGVIPGHLWDDCAAGSICTGGVCMEICGFEVAPVPPCGGVGECVRIDGVFADVPGEPFAGVCDEACDPLTQLEADGTACPGGQGCYLFTHPRRTVSACADAGSVLPGAVISGTAYDNTCVPGAQPRRRDSINPTMECGGLCRPADVTSTTNLADEGGVGADSCSARWGAAAPDDPDEGESCRYWWAREPPLAGMSPYRNAVGWCFKHTDHRYDSDGDGAPDAPFPRCAAVTTGDVLPPFGNPPHNDALYFWCLAAPQL